MFSITITKLVLAFFLFIILPIAMTRYMVQKTIEVKDKHLRR